jgi:hypothetical protein
MIRENGYRAQQYLLQVFKQEALLSRYGVPFFVNDLYKVYSNIEYLVLWARSEMIGSAID